MLNELLSLHLLCYVLCVTGHDTGESSPVYDTIVVGLGASGVGALSKLGKAGKKVLGLEAADYIGGRVKTIDLGHGVVEEGGEWIHGEKPSISFDLANEYKVPILKQSLDNIVYRSDGSLADNELLHELMDYCMDIADAAPANISEPLGEYITKRVKAHLSTRPSVLDDDDFMTSILNLMNEMVNTLEATNDWNEVSTSSTYETLEGDLNWSWHTYGYKTLFNILLNKHNNGTGLPVDILLNKEVVNIEWSQDPKSDIVVKCKDGSRYRSKNVIVTVSIGVLQERHTTLFTPQLPQKKTSAIAHITIGVIGKIILVFEEAWWQKNIPMYTLLWRQSDRSKLAKEDEWIARIGGMSVPFGSDNCLTLWTAGECTKHVETLPDDIVRNKSMELLRTFMGKSYNITEPIALVKTNWHSNPFTRGTYTYDSVANVAHHGARQDLAEPLYDSDGQPRVMFAGEATNQIHFSTVHGALETGFREAERILKLNEVKQ